MRDILSAPVTETQRILIPSWVSSAYATWFMREAKFLNNARMMMGTSCAVSFSWMVSSRDNKECMDGFIPSPRIFSSLPLQPLTAPSVLDEQPLTFKRHGRSACVDRRLLQSVLLMWL